MLISLHRFSKLSCQESHLPLTTYHNTFVLHFIYLFVLVDKHALCPKAHVHMIRDQLSGIVSLFSSHGFGNRTHIVRESHLVTFVLQVILNCFLPKIYN